MDDLSNRLADLVYWGRALSLCTLIWAPAVHAQIVIIKDPEQRRLWYSLQQLATEAQDLVSCASKAKDDPGWQDAVWRAYYRKTDEMARAVESYVTRYEA